MEQQILELQESLESDINESDLNKIISLLRQGLGSDPQYEQLLSSYRTMMQQYYCLTEQQWLDWIHDEPENTESLCQKALEEDHKYLGICKIYNQYLIQNQGDKNIMISNIEFWTLKYKCPIVNQMRVDLIEYLKNDETPKAKFIIRKMVMFPNENIEENAQIIPYEVANKAQKSKFHEETQVKFENCIKNEKKLKQFLVNEFRIFLEKVPKSIVFEYLMLYFEQIMPLYTREKDFWQLYLDFAHEYATQSQQKIDLYTRALKNCNFVSEFWIGYISLLEKDQQIESCEEICQQAIDQQTELTFEFAKSIFLFQLNYMSRNNQSEQEILDFTSKKFDYLSENFEGIDFSELIIQKAQILAYKLKCKKSLQLCMEQLVKSNGSFWPKYLDLMKFVTNFENSEDIQTLRGLYKRSILYGKNMELVYDWYQMEQQFGTSQTIEKARVYLVKNKLIKIAQKMPSQGKVRVEQEPEMEPQEKVTLFVKNVGKEMGEDQLQNIIQKQTKVRILACRIVRDSHGVSKEIAFIDLENSDTAQKCLENCGDLKIYKQRPPEQAGAEERTAFINNLPPNISENEIREKFENCGKIEDVRISKNLCYVQFEQKWSVEKAIYHNQGFNVQITKTKDQINKESHKSGKNTLHITNLNFGTTEDELQNYLMQTFNLNPNDISKTLIIKDRVSGQSKGYAYVEMAEKAVFKDCLASNNALILGDRNLVVRDAQKKFSNSKHASSTNEKPIKKREKKQEQKRVEKITEKPFEGKSNDDFKKFLGF